MKFIAHRGYWNSDYEKNTYYAFEQSLRRGYGNELDVRDYAGELIISHDIPNEKGVLLKDVARLHANYGDRCPLAINIKSNGLAGYIKACMDEYRVDNYFCFDMSVPDMMDYIDNNVNFYVRVSEYESDTPLLLKSKGVWLDGIYADIYFEKEIRNYLELGYSVSCVSSELHNRSNILMWDAIKRFSSDVFDSDNFSLCTDYPDLAKEFFYGE